MYLTNTFLSMFLCLNQHLILFSQICIPIFIDTIPVFIEVFVLGYLYLSLLSINLSGPRLNGGSGIKLLVKLAGVC